MGSQSVTTSLTPEVYIQEIHGSLQVRGWDRSEILIQANLDDTTLEKQDDVVHLSCQSDCSIRLPQDASIQVETVHSSARFKLLAGNLKIDQVHGSLALRNVGETQVGSVHGDLLAKQVMGDLQIGQVQGNTLARDVQGKCAVQQTSGNLDLRDITGEITASASGNARIRLSLLSGDSYDISAKGNLHCRLPDDASAQVNLSSGARDIEVKLPGEKTSVREKNHSLTMGNGDASVTLSAGAGLYFASQESDWAEKEEIEADFNEEFSSIAEELSQHITQQVESQIESQLEMLDEQMSNLATAAQKAGMSAAEMERIMQRARNSSERATVRARERMRRAQERLGKKLERKLAAAQRKVELKAKAAERRKKVHKKRTLDFERLPSTSTTAPKAPGKSVSDEERLMVLRMLEQKKIGLDEAEHLLAALEGEGT